MFNRDVGISPHSKLTPNKFTPYKLAPDRLASNTLQSRPLTMSPQAKSPPEKVTLDKLFFRLKYHVTLYYLWMLWVKHWRPILSIFAKQKVVKQYSASAALNWAMISRLYSLCRTCFLYESTICSVDKKVQLNMKKITIYNNKVMNLALKQTRRRSKAVQCFSRVLLLQFCTTGD